MLDFIVEVLEENRLVTVSNLNKELRRRVLRGKTTALPIMLGVSRWRTSCELVISVDVKDLYQVFISVVYINFICSISISAIHGFFICSFESPIVLFECSECSI